MNKFKNISTELRVIIFFVLTSLFFTPLQIFLQNPIEFPFKTNDLLIYLISITILGFLLIFLFAHFIKKWKNSIRQRLFACLFMFGVLLWIQLNLLVWDYPILDGKGIDWSANKYYGLIDGGLWIIGITLAFTKFKFFYQISKRASGFLILVQLISVLFYGFSANSNANFKEYHIDPDFEFSLSKEEKNVVILLLDAFQTDTFQKIIENDESYKKPFEGFTYFRNNLGGFGSTYPSLPLIMTGQYYDNSIPIQQYIKEAYLSNSLPLFMKEKGCDVYYHYGNTSYVDEQTASHVIKNSWYKKRGALPTLYKLSFFRSMPHFTKKLFEPKNDKTNQSLQFIERMGEKLNTTNPKCTFKFYYTPGVHPPLDLDGSINGINKVEYMPFSRENYETQAKAIIGIVNQFLNYLKEAGVYDNTMIVIIADHGINLGIENLPPEILIESGAEAPAELSGGLPLLLIKRFDEKGQMKISDAPVSSSDIAETIATELGKTKKFPGESVFNITENQKRERKIYIYDWANVWDKSYLPPMREYIIDGFSWLEDSWEPTYMNFTETGKQYAPPQPVYKLGSLLTFSHKGRNILPYLRKGWDSMEEGEWMWTTEKKAQMVIPLESTPANDLILKINLLPFIFEDKLPSQTIDIEINKTKIGTWIAKTPGDYEIKIPRSLIERPILNITLGLSNATRPPDIGLNPDNRQLGLGVFSIQIKEDK